MSGSGSPQFRTCSDSSCSTVIQDWTSSATPLSNNDYIQLRLTSSSTPGDTYPAHLVVGNTVDTWNVTPTGDCTPADPVIGTVCADGTVYAGKSPDGNLKMYATRCDFGLTWDGVACTGTAQNIYWNNGNTSGYVTVGTTNSTSGENNTTNVIAIDSDSGSGGTQEHAASQRFADLNSNGHTDWYLPSSSEQLLLYNNQTVIKNFVTNGTYYWTSSEGDNDGACARRFSDGLHTCTHISISPKHTAKRVRCVRR